MIFLEGLIIQQLSGERAGLWAPILQQQWVSCLSWYVSSGHFCTADRFSGPPALPSLNTSPARLLHAFGTESQSKSEDGGSSNQNTILYPDLAQLEF